MSGAAERNPFDKGGAHPYDPFRSIPSGRPVQSATAARTCVCQFHEEETFHEHANFRHS